jgi:uncharacterized protein YkwD
MKPRALITLALLAASCGPRPDQRTIVERMPDGSTRTTTITVTTHEAPPPPPRPADPLPNDPLVRYNLELLNSYRAKAGATALLYDAKISRFAVDGSKQFARDNTPHAHFKAQAQGAPGFGTHSSENQGDGKGADGKRMIAILLQAMIDEGPGGGHHDNMLSTKVRRVGIGLYFEGDHLYLTNDFSD